MDSVLTYPRPGAHTHGRVTNDARPRRIPRRPDPHEIGDPGRRRESFGSPSVTGAAWAHHAPHRRYAQPRYSHRHPVASAQIRTYCVRVGASSRAGIDPSQVWLIMPDVGDGVRGQVRRRPEAVVVAWVAASSAVRLSGGFPGAIITSGSPASAGLSTRPSGRSREPRWSLRTLARGMRAPAQL